MLPMNKEVSLGIKTEESPRGLPVPLRDRKLQVEQQDFHGLLER